MKKTDKYNTDIASNLEAGWTIHVLAFEIGAKGWVPSSCFPNAQTIGCALLTFKVVGGQLLSVSPQMELPYLDESV